MNDRTRHPLRSVLGWCLAMGLGIGVPAWAQDPVASFFNRSGTLLRLVPILPEQGQPVPLVHVTIHQLTLLNIETRLIDFSAADPSPVDLIPEALVNLRCRAREGGAKRVAARFHVVADPLDAERSRTVGTLACTPVRRQGGERLRLDACLELPFKVEQGQATPWHAVVRWFDPVQAALAEAWALEDEEADRRSKGMCVLM